MNKIKFRSAQAKDIDNVFVVFADAIKQMESVGIFQWDEVYPDRGILINDILQNQMYIGVVDNRVACVYVINRDCDSEYLSGKWKFNDGNHCVVHRLCVHPSFQNCGVGTTTMKHIELQANKMGFNSIRLDSFTKNPYACKMYENLGYSIAGVADWRKGRFYLMEKKI